MELIIIIAIVAFLGIRALVRSNKAKKEYKEIGSYVDYKPLSKTLNNKDNEYRFLQILGVKNINETVINNIKKISSACTVNDIKRLKLAECTKSLILGMNKAGIRTNSELTPPDNLETASSSDIIKVIKKSRIKYPKKYPGYGCKTCGEAEFLRCLIEVRVKQIQSNTVKGPNDLMFWVDAVKEMQNASLPVSGIESSGNASSGTGSWVE